MHGWRHCHCLYRCDHDKHDRLRADQSSSWTVRDTWYLETGESEDAAKKVEEAGEEAIDPETPFKGRLFVVSEFDDADDLPYERDHEPVSYREVSGCIVQGLITMLDHNDEKSADNRHGHGAENSCPDR